MSAVADPSADVFVVLTNLPDADSARRLAADVVGRRLAACANVLAPCRSVYRWNGAVETADETPVFLKTTRGGYAALEAAIRSLHPYELPEIVALPVAAGWPAYLAWVAEETGAEP